MSTLMERSDQALPVTELSRSAKRIIDGLSGGEHDKYVVMRNNEPAAVIMSIEYYEDLLDLIDDLRIELIAVQRLDSLDEENLISHEEMKKKFEK